MRARSSSPVALPDRAFTRILLIKPSSLGDVVHGLPVLRALRAKFPNARIDWMVNTTFAPLLEHDPDITELIRFDRKRYARIGRSPGATAEFYRLVRDLRAKDYELSIDLQGLFRTGFVSWACGAGVRVGFREAREGARLFYTHWIDTPDPDMHAVDRNLRVAETLGFSDAPVRFDLAIPGHARSALRSLLEAYDIADADRVAVVAPGARWETKLWPEDAFARTMADLSRLEGIHCVLVGSADEAGRCRRIAESSGRGINLAGRTPILPLAALIDRADVVLCQDSAVAHLAAALNRPMVCLVGPTNPRRTGPYRRLEDVIRLPLDCSPCYFRKLSQCPHHHRCMNELSATTVVEALRSAMRRSCPSPG